MRKDALSKFWRVRVRLAKQLRFANYKKTKNASFQCGCSHWFFFQRLVACTVDICQNPGQGKQGSVARDVVALEQIRKPALMEKLFWIGSSYSTQEISYRKLLGQLDDAGNTTTLARSLRSRWRVCVRYAASSRWRDLYLALLCQYLLWVRCRYPRFRGCLRL